MYYWQRLFITDGESQQELQDQHRENEASLSAIKQISWKRCVLDSPFSRILNVWHLKCENITSIFFFIVAGASLKGETVGKSFIPFIFTFFIVQFTQKYELLRYKLRYISWNESIFYISPSLCTRNKYVTNSFFFRQGLLNALPPPSVKENEEEKKKTKQSPPPPENQSKMEVLAKTTQHQQQHHQHQ